MTFLEEHRSVDSVADELRINTAQPLLHESVRRVIRRYLNDMGDHQPEELYRLVISEVEKPLLEEVMNWVNGNQCRASEILGLNRGTLRKKLRLHGLLE